MIRANLGPGIVGRTYLERGHPIVVLRAWAKTFLDDPQLRVWRVNHDGSADRRRAGPRNVLIRRETGELVVRPFRGLRRPAEP